MHLSSVFVHGGFVALQVVIQIGQHVVANNLALFAQLLEFGQYLHHLCTLADETVLGLGQRLL